MARRALILAVLATASLTLSGCLAGAAVHTAGAVVGTTAKVAVKTTGAVVGAALPLDGGERTPDR